MKSIKSGKVWKIRFVIFIIICNDAEEDEAIFNSNLHMHRHHALIELFNSLKVWPNGRETHRCGPGDVLSALKTPSRQASIESCTQVENMNQFVEQLIRKDGPIGRSIGVTSPTVILDYLSALVDSPGQSICKLTEFNSVLKKNFSQIILRKIDEIALKNIYSFSFITRDRFEQIKISEVDYVAIELDLIWRNLYHRETIRAAFGDRQ